MDEDSDSLDIIIKPGMGQGLDDRRDITQHAITAVLGITDRHIELDFQFRRGRVDKHIILTHLKAKLAGECLGELPTEVNQPVLGSPGKRSMELGILQQAVLSEAIEEKPAGAKEALDVGGD
jgi:hypothetical protein